MSRLGHGTTVRVFFPVATPTSSREPARERPAPAPATILVVDDEPLVREVATLTLEGEGFSVIAARDGREARDLLLAREDIAAVVLDLSLPDIEADEMAAVIRQQRPGLPVILSSGHHEPIATSGLAMDVAAYLQKPWQPSRLVAVVRHALARASGAPPR
jgi:CheY-like chemotaxis protein